ncbi:MAG: DNA primase [Tepidisphaeraceae bacterium]
MSSSPATNDSGDFRSQVLAAIDIVELIGQSVALKKRGRVFVGLCPFHSEKTPSFNVNQQKQFYHCFGCKEHGNAIDFVIKRDRVEFLDALKTLAARAGLEMPRWGVSKEKQSERQQLIDAHSVACAFFEKSLADPQVGAAARAYLEQRGVSRESVQRFQIGLAPDGWDNLLRSPLVKKFPPHLLASGGLLKAKTNEETGEVLRYYDTFRNRLMFPIRDENGRVIAFGGRVMPGSDDPAKYLNSPETPLFSKGRSIFGLDLAKQRVVETRTVAVVEGYTDVVMAHQHGVTNVVSILGTAMTEQHLATLRRFAERIVLLFDADTAGDAAVNRAVELFLTQPVEIAIASMPEGVDPDEYVIANGAEVFEKLLFTDATDALTFKWKQLSRDFIGGAGDLTGQQKAVQEYMQTLASARGTGPVDPMRWGSALARVSRLTDIPADELHRRFKGVRSPARRPAPGTPVAAAQAPTPSEPTNTVRRKDPLNATDRAERWLLGALLVEPAHWKNVQQHVLPHHFTDDLRRRLAEIYWDYQRDEGEPVFNEFLGLLTEGSGQPTGSPAGTEATGATGVAQGLAELAVELVEEASDLPDLACALADSVAHLAPIRRERDEQKKLIADLRRTSTEPASPEQDEVLLLRQLQEKARRPDVAGRVM